MFYGPYDGKNVGSEAGGGEDERGILCASKFAIKTKTFSPE